jgi:hypothetical protein
VTAGDSQEDPVEARYQQLQQNARAAHLAADHCHKGECWRRWQGTADLCLCTCDGCVRATALLVQAQREAVRRKRGPHAGGAA